MTDTLQNNTYHQKISEIPVVFIVGMGRSGTTLIRYILDSHKNVLLTNVEVDFYLHLYMKYSTVKLFTRRILNNLYYDLKKAKSFEFYRIEKKELKDKLETLEGETSFENVCKYLFYQFHSSYKKEEIKLLGDKCPQNSLYIEYIKTIFPNAKFIVMVRNPKDNVLSNKVHLKTKSITYFSYCWKHYNTKLNRFAEEYPEQFYVLRYEDLVLEPRKNIEQICNFLNIPFDSEMLNFNQSIYKHFHNPSKVIDKHKNNEKSNPITKKTNIWKGKLSGFEIMTIDSINYKIASIFNYDSIYNGSNILFKILISPKIFFTWISLNVKYKIFQYFGKIIH